MLIANYEQEYSDRDYLAQAESVEHLESYKALLDYLAKKGSKRRNFRHYATRSRIANILNDSAFYLTDGSSWNDEYDKIRFNPQFSDFKRFGICLSATTSESIAMWMLYGGVKGNGAMINFDKVTLANAMSYPVYECGFFDHGEFETVATLDASEIDFALLDVLYFSSTHDGRVTVERIGEKRRFGVGEVALTGMSQIVKHAAWSYETEVRLTATVSKLALDNKASKITAIRIPLVPDESFVRSRVFDSPVSDGNGDYCDSELLGTVAWDLCKDCPSPKHRR